LKLEVNSSLQVADGIHEVGWELPRKRTESFHGQQKLGQEKNDTENDLNENDFQGGMGFFHS